MIIHKSIRKPAPEQPENGSTPGDSSIDKSVGEKIRTLRLSQKMSLKALSQKTNLTPAV